MAGIDYKALYTLQDKVLKIIFDTEKTFYLTGGTCLSRFYIEKRYSDDLDLFCINNARFSIALKNLEFILKQNFQVAKEVSARDFVRLKINNLLQIDFVNDYVYHHGDYNQLNNGIILDNIPNILANKITAVIGRDNAKDFVLIIEHIREKKKNIKKCQNQVKGFK